MWLKRLVCENSCQDKIESELGHTTVHARILFNNQRVCLLAMVRKKAADNSNQ